MRSRLVTRWGCVPRRFAMLVLGLLSFGFTLGVSVHDAGAVSARGENACRRDYSRFCSAYSLGSTKLKNCMRANGKRLSKRCMRALVDSGQVSRRKLRKRRRRR